MNYLKPICPHCGSDNVTLDATATWDTQFQKWELNGTLDNADCQNCLEDDIKLKWIEAFNDPNNSTTQSPDRTGETVQQESVDPTHQS